MILILALAVLLTASSVAQDATGAVGDAATAWTVAAVKQDKAALDRALAADLTYSHSNGRTETKAEYIAAITTGPARYESLTFSDVKIRINGRTALLTGFVDVKMVRTDAFRVRVLQAYTQNDGRWQMSAHQAARVAN